jgi:SAM-dependent methyltransferase
MMGKGWVIYEKPLYRFFSMSGHRKLHAAIKRLHAPPPTIVDIGCGDGQFFSLMDPKRCVGIDINAQFLARLKNRYPGALAIQADFNNLPFSSGSVSCCTSAHVLEHLYFLAESLEETQRILSPEGKFIFTIPTEGGLGWELGRLLVTGPRLRSDYGLDVHDIMAMEHINDAKRVLRFARFYFTLERISYAPLPFLPLLSLNSSINVVASPLGRDDLMRESLQ